MTKASTKRVNLIAGGQWSQTVRGESRVPPTLANQSTH